MISFEKFLIKNPCDLVIVVGDVNSTMACTIVAKKLGTKVAHVEAGIRSNDMNMPEEQNVCNGITFVGKTLNYEIGLTAVELGFGGVFPWTLNYDSFEYNNTMVNYLYAGINNFKF